EGGDQLGVLGLEGLHLQPEPALRVRLRARGDRVDRGRVDARDARQEEDLAGQRRGPLEQLDRQLTAASVARRHAHDVPERPPGARLAGLGPRIRLHVVRARLPLEHLRIPGGPVGRLRRLRLARGAHALALWWSVGRMRWLAQVHTAPPSMVPARTAWAGRRAGGSTVAGMDLSLSAIGARVLRTRSLVRAPIALYKAGLGWLLGSRILMLEHRGRSSGLRRYVCLEVVERPSPDRIV